MLHLYVMYLIEKAKDILYGTPCRHCGKRGCTKTHATLIVNIDHLRRALAAEIRAAMEKQLQEAFARSAATTPDERDELLEPWRRYIEGGE